MIIDAIIGKVYRIKECLGFPSTHTTERDTERKTRSKENYTAYRNGTEFPFDLFVGSITPWTHTVVGVPVKVQKYNLFKLLATCRLHSVQAIFRLSKLIVGYSWP